MKIPFDVAIAAIRWVTLRNEAEGGFAPGHRDTTREASWRLRRWLVTVIRVDKKEPSLGVHLRGIEPHTAVSLLVLRQLAHVARLDLEDQPARVRVERKAAPIALRRGAECKVEGVRA